MSPVVVEPCLHGDTQTLSDPVDVVEVGDHLGGAGDAFVVESGAAQSFDVLPAHLRGASGELLGVLTQCEVGWVEPRRPPVDCDSVGESLVFDLVPEIVQVRRYSVVTLVGLGGDDSHHLALGTG